MSQIFHKSCYTSRSSGYKYRTLSTNTGERKKRDNREDITFEKKFRELTKAIVTRINKEVDETHKARDSILDNFEVLDAKINSMVELQKTVITLRNDLQEAGHTLMDITNKVDKIKTICSRTGSFSLRPSFRSQAPPITEEVEDHDSIVTHV